MSTPNSNVDNGLAHAGSGAGKRLEGHSAASPRGGRIYVAACREYEPSSIYRTIHDGLSFLGGASARIPSGCRVLIKPNLCLAQPPDASITTHPEVIRQLARIVVECGSQAVVGDSPIGKTSQAEVKALWMITGLADLTCQVPMKLSYLDSEGFETMSISIAGKVIKYLLAREFLASDVVINVPKFKTHALMGFTGAVKNVLGAVPGRSKIALHREAPSVSAFADLLADIYARRVPELTVMDGIWGIEGDGPGARGVRRAIGTLLVSDDGVLVDATCSRIIGCDPLSLQTTVAARRRGLGDTTAAELRVAGKSQIEDFFIDDFRMPLVGRYKSPEIIEKLYTFAGFRVGIDPKACVRCGVCTEHCPVGCVTVENEGVRIDTKRCIQCLCCIETCPVGAVSAAKNSFYEHLGRLGGRRMQARSAALVREPTGDPEGEHRDREPTAVSQERKATMSTSHGLPLAVIIDNYDSFAYNLYQYLIEFSSNVLVIRNDAVDIKELVAWRPGYVVISPGPKAPRDAGSSIDIINALKDRCKILGVCLGHQCINEVFGGTTIRAPAPCHGKACRIYNDQHSLFSGLPTSFVAARYHSLVADPKRIPQELEVSAWTADGIVMGLRHKTYAIEGLQFHPESFLTEYGKDIIRAFLYGTRENLVASPGRALAATTPT